jgi:hypothetical protein
MRKTSDTATTTASARLSGRTLTRPSAKYTQKGYASSRSVPSARAAVSRKNALSEGRLVDPFSG